MRSNMPIGGFKRRLTGLEFRHISLPNDEEKAALNEVIVYLNSLAVRKVNGDPNVQFEIDAVNGFLKTN